MHSVLEAIANTSMQDIVKGLRKVGWQFVCRGALRRLLFLFWKILADQMLVGSGGIEKY